jgi:hypothetical protein
MKATIVPAQITTVEDRIAGNLNLSQLLLLMIPLFFGSIEYIIFPPTLHFAPYKIGMAVIIVAIFSTLAMRIRGRILLQWTNVILSYNLRPRYYVFNKNDTRFRNESIYNANKTTAEKHIKVKRSHKLRQLKLDTADVVHLQQIVSDPRAKLTFRRTKKGGMDVLITEIK